MVKFSLKLLLGVDVETVQAGVIVKEIQAVIAIWATHTIVRPIVAAPRPREQERMERIVVLVNQRGTTMFILYQMRGVYRLMNFDVRMV